jgi:uncharacterized protein GlcG (DUF336 family)
VSISVDLARRVLEACKQRARDLRSPVSIAIVDASGHLVLFERMMAPYGWATGNISLAKANTSVMFNQATDAVAQWASSIPGFAASLSAMTDGKFIMAAGGWPIRVNGVTIGGVGVSGGNAPGRDDDIARAGLNAVTAYYQPAQPVAPVAPVPQPAPQPIAYAAPQVQQPQEASYQVASTPIQGYNNGGGEHSEAEAISDNSLYSDSTDNVSSTNYLSNEESNKRASLEEPPSSNTDLGERSGDQS